MCLRRKWGLIWCTKLPKSFFGKFENKKELLSYKKRLSDGYICEDCELIVLDLSTKRRLYAKDDKKEQD